MQQDSGEGSSRGGQAAGASCLGLIVFLSSPSGAEESAMEVPHLDLLESPEGCPSPLELKSAPSKKMWVKLRAL